MPGSKESLEFLDIIEDQGESEVFTTSTLIQLLDYKLARVWSVALIQLLFHLVYLAFQTIYPCWQSLLPFLVVQSIIEYLQIKVSNHGFSLSFWNFLDFLRLFLMLVFIVLDIFSGEDSSLLITSYCILTLIGWFTFCSQLRMFKKSAIFLYLML
jgi:hypothetical protein